MELKNKELQRLDEEIYGFNKIYGLILYSLNNVPNLVAIKTILKKSEELIKKLEEIKTNDEFELIFIENHIKNLTNQKVYLRYFSTRDKENIDQMIELFFGEGIIKKIKDKIKKINYESDWEFYLSYQDYSYRSYPSDSPELQVRFADLLKKIEGDIKKYSYKHYGLSKEFDCSIVLGQPYSNESNFRPSTKRVEISPSTFFAYAENNEININPAATIQTIFHEFVGHAIQSFNSKKLPKSMQDDSINTSVPTMSLHAEGLAQMADRRSIKFMEMYKEEYKIKEDYIIQRKLYLERKDIDLFWLYYQYLKIKNLEDKKFDYENEFIKETNNFGALMNFELNNQSPFSLIRNLCYPIGLLKIEKVYNNLIEEFGKEKESLINEAMSMGLLNIDVLEKFVKFYIKKSSNEID
jgi:hypothetical protein